MIFGLIGNQLLAISIEDHQTVLTGLGSGCVNYLREGLARCQLKLLVKNWLVIACQHHAYTSLRCDANPDTRARRIELQIYRSLLIGVFHRPNFLDGVPVLTYSFGLIRLKP